jgi:ABC-type sugar transport system substrate-binding protein
VQILFAKNDSIYQSQQLLEVIHRHEGLDGILVEPASRTAFPKIAAAATASGLAWVVLNCEADYLRELRLSSTVPAFAVTADNLEVGRTQGRQLAACYPLAASSSISRVLPTARSRSSAPQACSRRNQRVSRSGS